MSTTCASPTGFSGPDRECSLAGLDCARLPVAECRLPEDLGQREGRLLVRGRSGRQGLRHAGVLGSATGKGGASFGWWAAFLHNFVIPNASWIAKLISLGEVAIGIALILGLFTGLAAWCRTHLNFTYMMSGSAGVNPPCSHWSWRGLVLPAWRNAGYLGLDRYALNAAWWHSHFSRITERAGHRRASAHTPRPQPHALRVLDHHPAPSSPETTSTKKALP